MTEFMYDIDSVLIAGVLLVSMLLAIESGYRLGSRSEHVTGEDFKQHVNATSASLLGILALLLGFTFSLSLQRYDSRSEAVVDEANAIGTTYLRSRMLPAGVRDEVGKLLHEYVDLRVKAGEINLTAHQTLSEMAAETGRLHSALWDYARRAVELDPRPVTSGLFVQTLNELIDNYGKRDAELARHVPEFVLILLYITFIMTGAVVGYATGLAGHRPSFVTHILVGLIVILVFIILDLDRPRRGWIQVSQKSMLDLQTDIRELSGVGKQ